MTNNDGVAVPWGALSKNPDKYIDPAYLPSDVKIREPSKMTSNEVGPLYRFWLRREKRGMDVLRFKWVEPSHVRIPFGRKCRDLNWDDMPWMLEDDEWADLDKLIQNGKGKGKER
jgi:hypothetical protein